MKLLSVTEDQKIPKSSLLLVMPILQILSSTALEDCISMDEEGPSRQQLALNLLEMIQQECYRDDHQKVMNLSLFLLNKVSMWNLGIQIILPPDEASVCYQTLSSVR